MKKVGSRNKKHNKHLVVLLTLTVLLFANCRAEKQERELSEFEAGCEMSDRKLDSFLQSGSVKGYFTFDEFWHYWRQLRSKYPEFIGQKFQVGKTYKGAAMDGFYLGENMAVEDRNHSHKNIVFITGLHHSREPLTVTMVLYLVIKILAERGVCGGITTELADHWKMFFQNNIIMFIPMVNIDSYRYIEQNWQGPDGAAALMVRKNRHLTSQCTADTGGVDLNRNYSFMFGLNETGSSSNPCEEDYRGEYAFSEPETQAIRSYVNSRDNIVTGINMHTYGNAWIFPFNFVHDSHNGLLLKKKPKFYRFYKEFVNEMRKKHEVAAFGNAQKTVQYPTNGEAGDWLTARNNIVNLDVELGDPNKLSEKFYPQKNLIPEICKYNFRIFRLFFLKHNINLTLHQVRRNKIKKTISFVIFNKSISGLIDFKADLEPIFKLKSRKLSKKKSKNSWHVFNFSKSMKKKKENRKLSEGSYQVRYAIKSKCRHRESNMDIAVDNEIHGTLHGRYYLEIGFAFESVHDLETFESLDMDVHYGDNYIKKYKFYTYSVQKKRRSAKQRELSLAPESEEKTEQIKQEMSNLVLASNQQKKILKSTKLN